MKNSIIVLTILYCLLAIGGSTQAQIIINPSATSVSLNKTSLILKVGISEKLTATVLPAKAVNKAVTWSSNDPNVATVDAEGNVTAIAPSLSQPGPGNSVIVIPVTITVTTVDGGHTATCSVVVQASSGVPVSEVTVSPPELTLEVGATQTLTAAIKPSNATNKAVTWSSSNILAVSVDATGKLTANLIAKAPVTITATTVDGGKTATCAVTVTAKIGKPGAVTGVTLDKTTLNLEVGDSEKLTATVEPGDAKNKSVQWSSSDLEVATVDAEGNVTAIAPNKTKGGKEGTILILPVTITATTVDGSYKATCAVKSTEKGGVIETISVTGVTLDKPALKLMEGDVEKLTATVLPEDATIKTVTWSSDDESVVSVDETGMIVATGKGTASITVTTLDGGYKATCEIEVEEADDTMIFVTDIQRSTSQIAIIDAGKTAVFGVNVLPEDATNKEVIWTSDDEFIATVTATGTVTGVSEGLATITATTKNGGKQTTFTVLVQAGDIAIDDVAIVANIAAWASEKTLYIFVDKTAPIYVYNITGALVKTISGIAGEIVSTELPQGVYIVKAGAAAKKVVVN